MKKEIAIIIAGALLAAMPVTAAAQQTLSLEDCRQMAVRNDKELQQAGTQVRMAGYDRKIAFANYLPNVSATGAYIYNPNDFALISDAASDRLQNMGTTVHTMSQSIQAQLMGDITEFIKQLSIAGMKGDAQSAALAQKYTALMQDPLVQTLVGKLSQADMSDALNSLGKEIDDAFHPDMTHLFVGSVSVQQPIFMGGKIVAANDIARLAETLARTRYDQQCQEVMVNVDQAYWQVVSLAGKKRLAESYADLLHKMERDVDVSVREGVATEADALQVKVKANEADMLLTKAGNGLALSKMLLCKVVGLPLDSDIVLADESASEIPLPRIGGDKSMEDIYADRPETRSLELAGRIYDDKVKVARADALPQVAGIAAYSMVNPNLSNGFDKSFAGYFNAGVMVKIPIFHGGEHYYKIQKAKAEASLYKSRLEDAKELVNLQVTQIRKQEAEALEKLTMARSNLEAAEENLRTADIGYKEGVINANTALGAHTAWLQAQSEYIDAGIELQMLAANLNKAEGNYGSNGQGAVQDAMNE